MFHEILPIVCLALFLSVTLIARNSRSKFGDSNGFRDLKFGYVYSTKTAHEKTQINDYFFKVILFCTPYSVCHV